MPDHSRIFNIPALTRIWRATVARLTGKRAVGHQSAGLSSNPGRAAGLPAARTIVLRRIRSDMYGLADQLMHLDAAVPVQLEIHDPAHPPYRSRKDLSRFLS